ncbi:MAG: glutathione S-transferase family protein [Sphingomonadales bacterium]|nr:glutathione S-transferase family protein [Sphingomonadales bacterium]
MKLIIGNRNFSSWSLRAWLACRQSGLPFDLEVLPLYGPAWDERRRAEDLAPAGGKVPVLWDGAAVVWDSLAILEYLADKVGRDRFWPRDDAARGMARAMVAEMHAGFPALRGECPMNLRARIDGHVLSDAARGDVVRILTLWAQARARHGGGGPYLFGSFSAADIAWAPVVGRFITYGVPVPGFAMAYMEALWEHDWMQNWLELAEAEPWSVPAFEVQPR